MLNALMDNAGTIGVSLLLAALVTLIVLSLRRDRKRGKSSCGSGCASCPMAGACHKAKP
ncbi:MAG: FeoB-associated Cys-rich membrane protein [Clostridia bacterium]|nr:FeoB-associated Cys-rich membrane protein [Clostridia bacterium]